ncbi:uncharacterized protein LOC144100215 [Amblyomma americanum]
MHGLFELLLAGLCMATAVVAKLGPPAGPQKLQRDEIDTFEVVVNFPNAVAIADSDNNALLQCLSATRTELDQEALTATYVWKFQKAENLDEREITFHIAPGEKPGTLDMTIGDDPTPKEAIMYYADKNCIVMDVEDSDHHCLLWLRRELKDAAPPVCIDHFADVCGVDVPEHSRDLCIDGEGDV